MSKLYYKTIIEDLTHTECSDDEIEILLMIYESMVRKIAVLQAIEAKFHLKDFSFFKRRYHRLRKMTLCVEKRIILKQEQWWGTFEHGSQKLSVIASLKAP
jgi:hypothetical protein